MKKRFVIIFSIVVVLFSYLMIRKALSNRKEKVFTAKVRSLKVERGSIKKEILVTGEVFPIKSIKLLPKIPGRIESISKKNGVEISENIRVEKGDLIAVLENSEQRLQKDIADSSYEMAEASFHMAEIDLKDKEIDKGRMERLFKKKAISKKDMEVASFAYDRAIVNLDISESRKKEALAAKKRASLMLDESFIKAPISGVVSKRYLSSGDMVSNATPIVDIVDISFLKLIVGVSEKFLPKLKKGKECKVFFDAYPDRAFVAKLKKVYPSVDPLTKMVTVELIIDNSDEKILPGMFASLKMVVDERENVYRVPKVSLVNGDHLFVIEDNKVFLKKVSLGLMDNKLVEIAGGLDGNPEIVVLGQEKLEDGTVVEKVSSDEID